MYSTLEKFKNIEMYNIKIGIRYKNNKMHAAQLKCLVEQKIWHHSNDFQMKSIE